MQQAVDGDVVEHESNDQQSKGGLPRIRWTGARARLQLDAFDAQLAKVVSFGRARDEGASITGYAPGHIHSIGCAVVTSSKRGSIGRLEIAEHWEVPDVTRKESCAGANGGGCDGEVSAVDSVVAREPLAAEGAGLFRDLGVDWVPNQGGQQHAGVILLCRAHAGEDLYAGDFTRMKDVRGSLPFEQVASACIPSQVVDQYRGVYQGPHERSRSRREPERS